MRVAFFCFSTSAGCWTPADLDRGIGGSEEAAIHMASELAERGHRVSVHIAGAPPSRWFGPVEYANYDGLETEVIDIGIVWRRPLLGDRIDSRSIQVLHRYAWLHDSVSPENLTARESRFRKIMVLSTYHRSRFPDLPDDRFFLTSNGIDSTEFAEPCPERDPLLVVYGTEYNRGLRAVLESWPVIRRAVPHARLNVFFGWRGLEHRDLRRAETLKHQFAPLLSQDGISHLGRLGHSAVANQYLQAGVWAYPCSARETSCISAMKAQAGGAVPAVIPNGALRETVRFGFCTRRNYDELGARSSGVELVREWLDGIIDLLRSPERQESIRHTMIPTSRSAFDWANVAAAWETEFESALAGDAP